MMIYLSDQQSISDFIRKEINSRLCKRYKLTHVAEDIGVNYAKLYRFMRGGNTTTEFYDNFFKVYLGQWNC